jgi:hypothetical protein
MNMLHIPSLDLPKTLPNSDAIKSFGDNAHSYEPELWEFEYKVYRYLERVTDESLLERYKGIIRNMKALVSQERNFIPIKDFLSSWYWFRKEHQTRLEFALRGLSIPPELNDGLTFYVGTDNAPIRPKHPNSADVLFRYDKKTHITNLAQKGEVRLRPASGFKDLEGDKARHDEECSKIAFLPGNHTRITTSAGVEIPIIGDVEHKVSTFNYYVFCMACDWDKQLFTDFEADACIVIKDTEQFASSIESAAANQLAGWRFHHNPVQYFDPYERQKNEYFDASMSKDFRFAYQREYRFLWAPQNGSEPDGFKFLELGNLENFSEVYNKLA